MLWNSRSYSPSCDVVDENRTRVVEFGNESLAVRCGVRGRTPAMAVKLHKRLNRQLVHPVARNALLTTMFVEEKVFESCDVDVSFLHGESYARDGPKFSDIQMQNPSNFSLNHISVEIIVHPIKLLSTENVYGIQLKVENAIKGLPRGRGHQVAGHVHTR